MRLRAALALAVAVPLLLTGCGGEDDNGSGGSGGSARANDGFYGVISAEPLPDDAQLAKLGEGGAGTLRVNLAWGSVQAGPYAQYDWSHYDWVVQGAAENGIRVLATVYSTPSWVSSTAEIPPLGSAMKGFENFVTAAVKRYGSDGTFWTEHPDVPKLPITEWQAWNEPNSPLFWKPTPDAHGYLELLRAFSSTVKGADPDAKVLLGGLFPTPHPGIPMDQFLSEIYRGGGADLFDAVAVHPYASTPRKAIERAAQTREIMRRFDDDDTPIWITEVGWASTGTPPGLVVGPQGQANYVKETFELAAAARERLGLGGVIWYSLNDTPGPLWVGHCGLFTVEGKPKPAWEAFAQVAGGSS